MKGITGRPNLRGTVPFAITPAVLEALYLKARSMNSQALNAIATQNNPGVTQAAATAARDVYVALIRTAVSARDPNFHVPDQYLGLIQADFARRYPHMGQAIVAPPAARHATPNMTEQFIIGTAAYRTARAEIAATLGIRDAGHTVGHGSNSTARVTRGRIIDDLMSRVTGMTERTRIAEISRRAYGYDPKR